MNWLKGYWKLEEEISANEWDLKRLRTGKNENHSIQELENRLKEKKQLVQELIEILNTFKGLDNQILKLKYIDGMTLVKIAEELEYSDSYIKKRHADIIRTVKYAKEYVTHEKR